MSDFPCQNQSCKSYGKPHPNCKCHAGMAGGGEVTHFCKTKKPHNKGCQYFATGGEATDTAADPTVSTETVDAVPAGDMPDELLTVPEDDLPEDLPISNNEVPLDDLPDEHKSAEEKYGTPGQQVLAGVEGLAQGVGGPLATLAEKGISKLGVPGLTDEDITGRAAINPVTHGLGETAGLVGGMMSGTGQAGLIAKGVSKAAELAKLAEATGIAAKIGVGALKGAIESGLLQASDNLSKAMLGQGNSEEAVGSLLASGGMGGLFGALGGATSKGLEFVGSKAKGTALHSWLAGLGEAASGANPENSYARYLDPKAYDNGAKWWQRKVLVVSTGAGAIAANDLKKGYDQDDISGGLSDAATTLAKGAGLSYVLKHAASPVAGALLKVISDGEQNPRAIFEALNYANRVNSGAQKINRAVESLFKVGGQQTVDKYDLENNRSKLDKYIEDGGINLDINKMIDEQNEPEQEVPAFAKGGEVENQVKENTEPAVAKFYPEQNMMLATSKARMANYLSGLRPQKNQPKLIFDSEPDQREKTRTYNKALDVALRPLSVVDKINKGTIDPDDVKHFNAMYPDLNNVLQQKMTERIARAQMKGEKPNYKVKQGLSMFMGTALSSDLLPQNIQAAQAVFQQQGQNAPQQGAPVKNKKSSSSLSKSSQSFLTGGQALMRRQQKQ